MKKLVIIAFFIIVVMTLFAQVNEGEADALLVPTNKQAQLSLNIRERIDTSTKSKNFEAVNRTINWNADETAVIIIDMWTSLDMPTQEGNDRLDELSLHMDKVLDKFRKKGVAIIHMPYTRDGVDLYSSHPARIKSKNIPQASNLPAIIELSSYWIDSKEEAAGMPFKQAKADVLDRNIHPNINVKDTDFITQSSTEIWNIMEYYGMNNVILMGVFSNVCVVQRPCGARKQILMGRNTLVMRDMTDTLYESYISPNVDHLSGNRLMTEHIEKYICPTITSADLTGDSPFMFGQQKNTQNLNGED